VYTFLLLQVTLESTMKRFNDWDSVQARLKIVVYSLLLCAQGNVCFILYSTFLESTSFENFYNV
jgi:hypothetical protein